MLVARAPIGVAGPVNARLTAKSQPIVLRLRGGATLAVTVVGTDGKPIETANIELRGNDFQTTTTEHGNASFAPVVPGNYELIAWADGMARDDPAHACGGQREGLFDARVGRAGKLRAASSMKVAPGSRTRRSSISARADFAVRSIPGAIRSSRSRTVPSSPGARRGLGDFSRHDEHSSGMSSLVTLDGKTEKSGVMVTLPAGAEVRGRVVDTNNQPVAGARVEISPAWRGGRGRRRWRWRWRRGATGGASAAASGVHRHERRVRDQGSAA